MTSPETNNQQKLENSSMKEKSPFHSNIGFIILMMVVGLFFLTFLVILTANPLLILASPGILIIWFIILCCMYAGDVDYKSSTKSSGTTAKPVNTSTKKPSAYEIKQEAKAYKKAQKKSKNDKFRTVKYADLQTGHVWEQKERGKKKLDKNGTEIKEKRIFF